MLRKTSGIVLSTLKYKESSIISRIYTRELGTKSYIINSVRSAKSKNKAALYRPMSILDLLVYERSNANINRISEAKFHPSSFIVLPNISKTSILLFLSEVLNKALIHEEEQDYQLFDFINRSLIYFSKAEANIENFHLIFLIQLTNYLGFDFEGNTALMAVKNNLKITEKDIPSTQELQLLNALRICNFNEQFSLNSNSRNSLLRFVLQYYSTFISSLDKINSLDVLSEVFK